MLIVILLLIGGSLLLAHGLGWRPTWDAVMAAFTGTWAGVKALFKGPATSAKLLNQVQAALGVFIIVLAFLVTPVSSPQTIRDAIIAFQIEHGLTGDGIWGPRTHREYLDYLKGL